MQAFFWDDCGALILKHVTAQKPWDLTGEMIQSELFSCFWGPFPPGTTNTQPRDSEGVMWCSPQLSHPSILLGEKRQGERAFYQARVDSGVVEKNVDRSTVVVQEENHSIEMKRSYPTLPSGPLW